MVYLNRDLPVCSVVT